MKDSLSGVIAYVDKHHKQVKTEQQQKDFAKEIVAALNKDKDDESSVYNFLSGYYDTPWMQDNETKEYYDRRRKKQGGMIEKLNHKVTFKELFTK